MKELDRLRYFVPFSNCHRQKRNTKSLCSAENLSNFATATCIKLTFVWNYKERLKKICGKTEICIP